MITSIAIHEGENYLIFCERNGCDYAVTSSTEWGAEQAADSHWHENSGIHNCHISEIEEK